MWSGGLTSNAGRSIIRGLSPTVFGLVMMLEVVLVAFGVYRLLSGPDIFTVVTWVLAIVLAVTSILSWVWARRAG